MGKRRYGRSQHFAQHLLEPVDAKQRDAMLRSLESVQNHEERVALDAAARLIAILRYDAPGDPIQAIDALDKAMRRLARV